MGCTAKSEKSYHTSEQLKKKVSSGTKTWVTKKVVYSLAFKKKGICVVSYKQDNHHESFLFHKNGTRKSHSSNQYMKASSYFPHSAVGC